MIDFNILQPQQIEQKMTKLASAPSTDTSGSSGLLSGLGALAGKIKDALHPSNDTQYSGTGQNDLNQQMGTTQPGGLQGALQNATSLEGLTVNNPTLRSYLNKANPNLDPSTTPWCAGFVGSVLNAGGVKGTGSLAAKSYLNFGTPTDKPNKGDIVVFNDLTGNNNPAHGHVGFVDHIEGDKVYTLGGNQSGTVSLKPYPISMVAGYRVAPNGQQVKQYAAQNGMNSPQDITNAPKQQDDLGHIMGAIAQNETGGAKNPYQSVTRSRQGSAIGKYQVMDFNVPDWTRQALGHPLTPQQFKNSPEAQEKTAQYMIGNYVKKYGPSGAARAWFGGEGSVHGNDNASDGNTTVKGYQKQFERHYLQSKNGLSFNDPDQNNLPAGTKPTKNPAPYAPSYPPLRTASAERFEDTLGNTIDNEDERGTSPQIRRDQDEEQYKEDNYFNTMPMLHRKGNDRVIDPNILDNSTWFDDQDYRTNDLRTKAG